MFDREIPDDPTKDRENAVIRIFRQVFELGGIIRQTVFFLP